MIRLSRNFDFHYNLGLWITFLVYNISLIVIFAVYHQTLFEKVGGKEYLAMSIVFILWAFLEIANRSILLGLLSNKINDYRQPNFYLDSIRIAQHFYNKERLYYWIQFNINIIFLIGITIWISVLHRLYTNNFLLWILVLTKIIIYFISFVISGFMQKYVEKHWKKSQFNLLPIRYSPSTLSLDVDLDEPIQF